MKTWREGAYTMDKYSALTPHYFWDGKVHYWPGIPIVGMENYDPSNPNCCPVVINVEEKVVLSPSQLSAISKGLKKKKIKHHIAGESVGMKLSRFRQRLYGRRPFLKWELDILEELLK